MAVKIQPREPIKIQLGAQIDGFSSVIYDTILIPIEKSLDVVSGLEANLILATTTTTALGEATASGST